MFPAAKKKPRLQRSEKSHGPANKRKPSPGKPSWNGTQNKAARKGPGGQHRDKRGKDQQRKGWKKSRDDEAPFGKKMKPAGKAFGTKKTGDRGNKFGAKRKFDGKKNKDNFRSKGQKDKSGFKKKGAGTKRGFTQRKGKG